MALAYYDLVTGIVHRVVYADDQTDDELETVRRLPEGQGVIRFKGTFIGMDSFDLAAVQAHVDKALGR